MIHYPRLAALLAAVAVPFFLLAPAGQAHAAPPAAHARTTVQVTIQNFAFSPKTVTVAPGTTIMWTNKDSAAHTVTSDSGSTLASGDLSQGKSYSHTFTKAGTYAYHCAIHPYMKATVVVSGGSTTGGGSMNGSGMGSMGSMGPMTTLSLLTGYYDNHAVLFLATDSSDKNDAMSHHINYSASLAKSLSSADQIYLVTNGTYAGRGPVFDSEPGESGYTPLWQEVKVTWKDPSKAVALGQDNQIADLAKKGMLTLTKTGIVLNCPIIAPLSGSSAMMGSGMSSMGALPPTRMLSIFTGYYDNSTVVI
jgi:plastocyanin